MLPALVGVADGVGRAGIRNAAHIVDLAHIPPLPVRPGQNGAVAVTHGLYVDPLVVGGGIAVVGPEEGADPLLRAGGLELAQLVWGHLHDLAGAQLLFKDIAQLLVGEGFEGDCVAVLPLTHGDGDPAEPIPGGDQGAVLLQDQDGGRALDGFLGEADALREVALLVDQRRQQLHGVDLSAGLGVEVSAGEGEILLDQRLRVVDAPDHADGVGAEIGADQQGLGLGIADAADGRLALHLVKDFFKFRAEGRVFYVVDFTLQTDLRVKSRHPPPAGAEMGMVVSSEENVGHTVVFGCNAEKASHIGNLQIR